MITSLAGYSNIRKVVMLTHVYVNELPVMDFSTLITDEEYCD